jgi:N-acetylglucosaminyl-diphospho-decaprenol L-rhamnosyltransferase
MYDVDVAIVTVSTNKLNTSCIQSMKRVIEKSSLKMAFVLVDNASTEYDAYEFVTEHMPEAIVILRNKNHGFGSSCNRGARDLNAKYYFFLNPDTDIVNESVIDALHKFMTNYPRVGIVAPKLKYMDGRVQETCRRFPKWYTPIIQRTNIFPNRLNEEHRKNFLMEDFSHDEPRMVDWVQGSAFMIDGDLFREIGGFDERYFMYYEDVDLCRQCWEKGRPVYYLPEVELFHEFTKASAKQKSTLEGLFTNRLLRAHIGSWLKYMKKWRSTPQL